MRRRQIVAAMVAFVTALLLRLSNAPVHEISPVDELYHLKRMTRFVELDPDRGVHGAFCPWPPLYDRVFGAVAHALGAHTKAAVQSVVIWLPPIGFALFVALAVLWMQRRFGWAAALTAGAALAASPFAVTVSWVGSIDHHWTEPIFVVAILAATTRVIQSRADGEGSPAGRGSRASLGMTLGLALTAAMFVQTALLVAAALAFVILFFTSDGRDGAIAFGLSAIAIVLYRATRPPGYPDNAWFLGWTHAALFGAACVALWYVWRAPLPACGERVAPKAPGEGRCLPSGAPHPALRATFSPQAGRRIFGLLAGACVVLATPTAPASLLAGSRFFGGERWLHTISEFQPVWKARGDDLVSILFGFGAGAILVWWLAVRAWRERDPVRGSVAAFAILYLLLTITSRRFWNTDIPLLAIAGGIAAASIARRKLRIAAIAAVALIPPIQFVLWMAYAGETPVAALAPWLRAARFLQTQPAGRVLAPWSVGHMLDVVGEHAVIIDNFGTMPGEVNFERACDAFLTTHEESLARYCDDNGIRFVAYEPTGGLRAAANLVGLDPNAYNRTKLAKATVWRRAYDDLPLRYFRRIYAAKGIVIVERR